MRGIVSTIKLLISDSKKLFWKESHCYFAVCRLVMEELALEQHSMSRELDERQILERKMIGEVEHLQEEVEHAKQSTELACQCAESLKFEVSSLEAAIVEKKMQVERLVTDMKEANLQSLTVACQDEQVKHLLEGEIQIKKNYSHRLV